MSETDTRPYDHRADKYDHAATDTDTPTDEAPEAPESFHTAYRVFDGPAARDFLRTLLGGADPDGMTSTPFASDDERHALNADDLQLIVATLMYSATRMILGGGKAPGAFAMTRLAERIEHMRQHGGSVVVVPF